MGERTRLWSMFGIGVVFTVVGLVLLWVERDVAALFVVLFFGGCAGVFAMQLREGAWRVRKDWPGLDGDAIMLRRNVWTMRLHAVASILMGVGGGVMVFADADAVGKVAGAAGLLLFGGGGLSVLIAKGGMPSVALRADAMGIGFGEGVHPRFRWHDLDGFGIVSIQGERHLGFLVLDPARVRAGRGALARMGAGLDERLGPPDSSVAQTGLDAPLEPVADALERLWERHA